MIAKFENSNLKRIIRNHLKLEYFNKHVYVEKMNGKIIFYETVLESLARSH